MNVLGNYDDPRYGTVQRRRYYGKYAGKVTANDPPQSGPHRGQVRVQLPGILEETADGSGHQPIEVLAAPAFLPGYFFVPEEKDPVWVEFVAGDINYPIWTGVWYPQDATPNAADGSPPTRTQRVIRTKSGHVVQLDDTGGSEQLVIQDGTNNNTITSNASGITLASQTAIKISFQPQSGTPASITVDGNGVTAQCGQCSITLTATQITLAGVGVTLSIANGTVDVS